MRAVERNAALKRLAREAARQRIANRELTRAIYCAAHDEGLSQRQISDALGTLSQASVQRTLQRVAENPSMLDETPAEVIDRRTAGLIDTKDMMRRLLNWTYTFGYVPHIEGTATDAYNLGGWDEVERAYYRGLLSDHEFSRLVERHKELIERAARAK